MPRAGLYMRLCAALVRPFVSFRRCSSWQWYRRAKGGRWSSSLSGRWFPVRACPAGIHTDVVGGGPMPAGLCFEFTDGTGVECHCEVWP